VEAGQQAALQPQLLQPQLLQVQAAALVSHRGVDVGPTAKSSTSDWANAITACSNAGIQAMARDEPDMSEADDSGSDIKTAELETFPTVGRHS
jgi:hypothetical protein